MTRRGIRLIILIIAFVAVPVANAAVGDSATGHGTHCSSTCEFLSTFAFDARVVADDGAATGTFSFLSTTSDGTEVNRFSGMVTCMVVDGHRAAIKGVVEQSVGDIPVGGEITWWIDDNANVGAPDTISARTVSTFGLPCGSFDEPLVFPITSGDIEVVAVGDPTCRRAFDRLKRLPAPLQERLRSVLDTICATR